VQGDNAGATTLFELLLTTLIELLFLIAGGAFVVLTIYANRNLYQRRSRMTPEQRTRDDEESREELATW
jgi:hypothetical protein